MTSNEDGLRSEILRNYQILDSSEEKEFDKIADLASLLCGCKLSGVSFVDLARVWFKAKNGFQASQAPRENSFCANAILSKEITLISQEDIAKKFGTRVLSTDATHLGFYAGAPLISREGCAIGMLFVADYSPKSLTQQQIESLKTLAGHVVNLLDLRKVELERGRIATELAVAERTLNIFKKIADSSLNGICIFDPKLPGFPIVYTNPSIEKITGFASFEKIGHSCWDLMGENLESEYSAKIVSGGTANKYEFRFESHHRDGKKFWAEATLGLFRSDNGDSLGALEIKDVSYEEHLKSMLLEKEEEVKKSRSSLIDSLASLDVGMVQVGADHNIEYVSPTSEKIMGVRRERLIGKSKSAIFADKLGRKNLAVFNGREVGYCVKEVGDMETIFLLESKPSSRADSQGKTVSGNSYHHLLLKNKSFKELEEVAQSDALTIIESYPGGKAEIVAKEIHEKSKQKAGPFIYLNCRGIPEQMLLSQIFGHKRGAFSSAITDKVGIFELAENGTAFIDNFSRATLKVQADVFKTIQGQDFVPLGGIQAHKLRARIILGIEPHSENTLGAGKELIMLAKTGARYITIESLSNRRNEIPAFMDSLLQRFNKTFSKEIKSFSPKVVASFLSYQWPGNFVELESEVRAAVEKCNTELIELQDVNESKFMGTDASAEQVNELGSFDEYSMIMSALKQSGGDRNRAAQILGISRATLFRRLAKFRENQTE